MKTVLIYGDSNTFGQTGWPIVGEARLDYNQRWTSRVQHHFKDEIRVIAEGLGGRTAGNVQGADSSYRNGQEHFRTIYNSHEPVDILIVALGTNDCQSRYQRTAQQIIDDLLWYQLAVADMHFYHAMPTPKVLFITPPVFTPLPDDPYFTGQQALRNEVATTIKTNKNMECIEINDISTAHDGVHLSPEGHREVAITVEQKLKELL